MIHKIFPYNFAVGNVTHVSKAYGILFVEILKIGKNRTENIWRKERQLGERFFDLGLWRRMCIIFFHFNFQLLHGEVILQLKLELLWTIKINI